MTIQISEKIKIGEEYLKLLTEPLTPLLEEKDVEFTPQSSSCWRGYIGTWELKDGSLYLIDFSGKQGFRNVEFKDLSQEESTSPVKATWFSGKLRILLGDMAGCFYIYKPNKPRYFEELEVEIDKGDIATIIYKKFQHRSIEASLEEENEDLKHELFLTDAISISEKEMIDLVDEEGIIRMQAYPSSDTGIISLYATAQKAKIDWGDGTIEEFTPNGAEVLYTHEYANENLHLILLQTEGMVSLGGTSGFKHLPMPMLRDRITIGEGYYVKVSIGRCPELKKIYCSSYFYSFRELNIEKVAHQLEVLHFNQNDYPSLDISNCTSLIELYCTGNRIDQLSLESCYETIKVLHCGDNPIESLDISKCHKLIEIDCDSTYLRALDFKNNPNLEKLKCSYNDLKQLDLNNLRRLTSLDCRNTQIKNLDVSKCSKLKQLNCDRIKCKTLQIHGLKDLYEISCGGCESLSILQIKDCDSLFGVYCRGNKKMKVLQILNCNKLQRVICVGADLKTLDIPSNLMEFKYKIPPRQ